MKWSQLLLGNNYDWVVLITIEIMYCYIPLAWFCMVTAPFLLGPLRCSPKVESHRSCHQATPHQPLPPGIPKRIICIGLHRSIAAGKPNMYSKLPENSTPPWVHPIDWGQNLVLHGFSAIESTMFGDSRGSWMSSRSVSSCTAMAATTPPPKSKSTCGGRIHWSSSSQVVCKLQIVFNLGCDTGCLHQSQNRHNPRVSSHMGCLKQGHQNPWQPAFSPEKHTRNLASNS